PSPSPARARSLRRGPKVGMLYPCALTNAIVLRGAPSSTCRLGVGSRVVRRGPRASGPGFREPGGCNRLAEAVSSSPDRVGGVQSRGVSIPPMTVPSLPPVDSRGGIRSRTAATVAVLLLLVAAFWGGLFLVYFSQVGT